MTKEEAVRAAVKKLKQMEQTEEIREIIRGLEKFEPGQYRRKWTQEAVYEAVRVWSLAHGHLPSAKEMEIYRELPGSSVIRREFGISSGEFLRRFFAGREKKQQVVMEPEADCLQQFIMEFNRIRPESGRDYDMRRAPGILSWMQTARALRVSGWADLLLLAGVDVSCLKQVPKELRSIRNNGGYEVYRKHNPE
ncbi:MAG: hypothetical protein K2G89_02495 [Lachnospiraceae bacterium]|nr:hypothetical protein [Lachnospiraceae bacterium]